MNEAFTIKLFLSSVETASFSLKEDDEESVREKCKSFLAGNKPGTIVEVRKGNRILHQYTLAVASHNRLKFVDLKGNDNL